MSYTRFICTENERTELIRGKEITEGPVMSEVYWFYKKESKLSYFCGSIKGGDMSTSSSKNRKMDYGNNENKKTERPTVDRGSE